MHKIGLIGGTFDRFHLGHLALIHKGLSKCDKLEIWITSDSVAKRKDPKVNDWETRSKELIEYLGGDSFRVSTYVLEDNYGPSVKHRDATAIFCTKETIQNCHQINKKRSENDLPDLDIYTVDKVSAWDGAQISSSRIRSGEIDREGQPWIPETFRVGNHRMTPEVEVELKEPFGRLVEGSENDRSVAISSAMREIGEVKGPIIAVGDVTVLSMQQFGIMPDIALVDGLTKRKPWEPFNKIDEHGYDNILECESPAGHITQALLICCESSITNWHKDGSSTLIKITGEEDLAPLILHPLAPLGSVIMYGQPDRGVVIRWTEEASKERCRNLLLSFKKD